MTNKLRTARTAAVLAVALTAAALSACASSNQAAETSPPTGATSPDTSELCPESETAPPQRLAVGEVFEMPDNGRQHVVCPDYAHTPPAGGSHFPAWQNCGIYNQPIQNQTAVHSLEHGAVWVAYQTDIDPAVLQTITDRLRSERFALVAPYPGLQNTIVLTAWRRQLAVNDWFDPAVDDFLDTYLGRYSPTAPEAGASCGQAVGSAPDSPNLNYPEILEQVS